MRPTLGEGIGSRGGIELRVGQPLIVGGGNDGGQGKSRSLAVARISTLGADVDLKRRQERHVTA